MSRHEAPREDILAEARALIERIELLVPDLPSPASPLPAVPHAAPPLPVALFPVVVGFRDSGCASFYFDQDPVYQFNTAGELRRTYVRGLRYKADRGALVALTVDRSPTGTNLLARRLSAEETAAELAALETWLATLQQRLAAGVCEIRGQEPRDADVRGRVERWLRERPRPIQVAAAPNAR